MTKVRACDLTAADLTALAMVDPATLSPTEARILLAYLTAKVRVLREQLQDEYRAILEALTVPPKSQWH
ncbi:hypothetical protein ABIA25_000290 [Sinorhizobium fredii]|uniref:hypothetical protein n=1 Tax=Rhizobium fredii TaxID=380 RepID=UPI003514F8EF